MALANSNTIICHLLPGSNYVIHLGREQQYGRIALLKDKSAAAMVRFEPGLSAWESSEYSNIPRHLHLIIIIIIIIIKWWGYVVVGEIKDRP